MSDTPPTQDDLGGDKPAGEHPDEPDVPEEPHPDQPPVEEA